MRARINDDDLVADENVVIATPVRIWPLAIGGLAAFGLLLYANSGRDERAATAPATTTGQAPAQPAPRTPTR